MATPEDAKPVKGRRTSNGITETTNSFAYFSHGTSDERHVKARRITKSDDGNVEN